MPWRLRACCAAGKALLVSAQDAAPTVVAEALNAIFDVFHDEAYAANEAEIGLLQRLQEILPVFRAKIAAFKTRDKLVMGRLREALLNLKRFIKYKHETRR